MKKELNIKYKIAIFVIAVVLVICWTNRPGEPPYDQYLKVVSLLNTNYSGHGLSDEAVKLWGQEYQEITSFFDDIKTENEHWFLEENEAKKFFISKRSYKDTCYTVKVLRFYRNYLKKDINPDYCGENLRKYLSGFISEDDIVFDKNKEYFISDAQLCYAYYKDKFKKNDSFCQHVENIFYHDFKVIVSKDFNVSYDVKAIDMYDTDLVNLHFKNDENYLTEELSLLHDYLENENNIDCQWYIDGDGECRYFISQKSYETASVRFIQQFSRNVCKVDIDEKYCHVVFGDHFFDSNREILFKKNKQYFFDKVKIGFVFKVDKSNNITVDNVIYKNIEIFHEQEKL